MKKSAKKILHFIVNPHFLLCFAVAWMITNGWSYILLGLGTYLEIEWMIALSGAYLAFLWLPISPEKIVTLAIAIALLRGWLPRDKKTLAVLRELHAKALRSIKRKKRDRSEKTADPSKSDAKKRNEESDP